MRGRGPAQVLDGQRPGIDAKDHATFSWNCVNEARRDDPARGSWVGAFSAVGVSAVFADTATALIAGGGVFLLCSRIGDFLWHGVASQEDCRRDLEDWARNPPT